MKLFIALALISVAAVLAAQTLVQAKAYAEGQVWTYRARVGDEQSLVKIQKVEPTAAGTIYHVSVIGFRLKNPSITPALAHAPVSKQSLDESVLRLVEDPGNFPSVEPGIAEWRAAAEGSYFTIPIAEIVQLLDDASSRPTQ